MRARQLFAFTKSRRISRQTANAACEEETAKLYLMFRERKTRNLTCKHIECKAARARDLQLDVHCSSSRHDDDDANHKKEEIEIEGSIAHILI